MSDNWVVNNLINTFNLWNDKIAEMWELLLQTPETFKGGAIWEVMLTLNDGIKAIAYALLVLFLGAAIFSETMNFKEWKNWQTPFRFFIKFVCAKAAITYGMDLLLAIFRIGHGVVLSLSGSLPTGLAAIELPLDIQTAIEGTGFLASIPLWLVTILGTVIVTALSLVLIMTVYGRFFRLYLYSVLAPLSTFAGEGTASIGKTFIKSYAGVCLEGGIILVCIIIYGAYTSTASPGVWATDAPTVNIVWQYLLETVFNMLMLVGLIKGSDRIVKEAFGL